MCCQYMQCIQVNMFNSFTIHNIQIYLSTEHFFQFLCLKSKRRGVFGNSYLTKICLWKHFLPCIAVLTNFKICQNNSYFTNKTDKVDANCVVHWLYCSQCKRVHSNAYATIHFTYFTLSFFLACLSSTSSQCHWTAVQRFLDLVHRLGLEVWQPGQTCWVHLINFSVNSTVCSPVKSLIFQIVHIHLH